LREHNSGNKKNPIQITIHCPGYVVTEIHEHAHGNKKFERDMNKFISKEECAEQIITAMDRGYFEYLGMTVVAIFSKFMPFIPQFIIDALRDREHRSLKLLKE